MRRYEILLPLYFNDKSTVPCNLHEETINEIVERFGGISVEKGGVGGLWTNDAGNQVADEMVCIYVDVESTAENTDWFLVNRTNWQARFLQDCIYIVSYEIHQL